jgi:hypothetical protein
LSRFAFVALGFAYLHRADHVIHHTGSKVSTSQNFNTRETKVNVHDMRPRQARRQNRRASIVSDPIRWSRTPQNPSLNSLFVRHPSPRERWWPSRFLSLNQIQKRRKNPGSAENLPIRLGSEMLGLRHGRLSNQRHLRTEHSIASRSSFGPNEFSGGSRIGYEGFDEKLVENPGSRAFSNHREL